MTEWRLNKRGALFGFQGGRVVREDFASAEIINPAVTDGGLPVPVLFGTRFIEPTVVAWNLPAAPQATLYYQPGVGNSLYYIRTYTQEPNFRDDQPHRDRLVVKMNLVSMIMVLCSGEIDSISRFVVDELPVIIDEVAPPRTIYNVDAPGTQGYINKIRYLQPLLDNRKSWTNSVRFVVSRADATVFGGSTGGLGFPDARAQYLETSRYSEFFFNKGISTKNVSRDYTLDRNTRTLGVSSFMFETFNFGGATPLKKWRVAATRIDKQTARIRPTEGGEAEYKPQWASDLARINQLQFTGQNTYYMIVVDRTLGPGYLSALKEYVMGLPFDSSKEQTTEYRLIEMSYQDCIAVHRLPMRGYKMEQFSGDYLLNQRVYNRSKSRNEYVFEKHLTRLIRSGYYGRSYWSHVSMTVDQARAKGCAFTRNYRSRLSERVTNGVREGDRLYTDQWEKDTNIRKTAWRNFGDPELVANYPIQRPITFSFEPAYNFILRTRSGPDNLSFGIRSFNLTNDRDLLSRHFDDQIAKARRERINAYTYCKMVSEDDGKFILQTCANDLNRLTRGGSDIRYSSLVIFAMTNVFGTTGPEPFTQARRPILVYDDPDHQLRGRRWKLGRSVMPGLLINGQPATPTIAESALLYNQLPSDDNSNRNFSRDGGLPGALPGYDYIGMSDAPLFASMFNFLPEFVNTWMSKITNPEMFPQPENAPQTYEPPLRDFQITALQNNQPEIRVFLWEHDLNSVKRDSRLRFTVVDKGNDATLLTTLDSSSAPIKMPLFGKKPVDEVLGEISTLQPLGYTMNPVHALRECLIDPDWGDAISESLIDETTFRYAAQVCHDEGLDFCYVHDNLGGVDKLVEEISDYIEGVTYYEPATDKVVLRLLRDDYDIDSLPSFNETNISQIQNYRLMFASEQTNSLTVRFHDAARGSSGSFTVHDVEAATRTGGVSSVILNYDGCATATAAEKVAVRELNALSRQLIAFTAVVDPPDNHLLGLGEPVLFSYRDLGINRVVMRVSSIGYGDGTTGGITLNLIQDVYSGIQKYDPLVEEDPDIPIEEPQPIDPFANLRFIEVGWPRVEAPGVVSPSVDITKVTVSNRYLQAGIKYDPENPTDLFTVQIDGQYVAPSVGTLLTPIGELESDPRAQSFVIRVLTGALTEPTTFAGIRIDDEIFHLDNSAIHRDPGSDVARMVISERAVADTVAKAHAVGADVWYLQFTWADSNPFSDSSYSIVTDQGGAITRRVLRPDVDNTLVGRLARPYPPYWVSINGCWSSNLRIGGDIYLSFLPKIVSPWGLGRVADVVVDFTYEGGSISGLSSVSTPSVVGQVRSTRLLATDIRRALNNVIEPDPSISTYPLVLSVSARYNDIESWQSWVYNIEWSFDALPRFGWNRNWGNDWGGTDGTVRMDGWDYNWDQSFGD